jgi:putative protease
LNGLNDLKRGLTMEVLSGKVTHYYKSIGVAAVEVNGSLKVGDLIHIKGHTTDFEQKIESMQIEHQDVKEANKGQVIGLRVKDYVREHDLIYRVEA